MRSVRLEVPPAGGEVERSHLLQLVRHGRVIAPAPRVPMSAAAFERWRAQVDDVGIDPRDTPPHSLVERAGHAGRIVSSDLPRAVESARAIAPGTTIETTPLLREIRLPLPGRFSIPLPHAVWEALTHARWGWDILRRADASPADLERARACARWLEDRSRIEPSILVVTHGVFRRLLARILCERGWHLHGRRRYSYWSVWELSRATAPSPSDARSSGPGR